MDAMLYAIRFNGLAAVGVTTITQDRRIFIRRVVKMLDIGGRASTITLIHLSIVTRITESGVNNVSSFENSEPLLFLVKNK